MPGADLLLLGISYAACWPASTADLEPVDRRTKRPRRIGNLGLHTALEMSAGGLSVSFVIH